MKFLVCVVLVSAVSLGACTWVETTESGAQVQLLTEPSAGCQHLGRVTTSVKDSLGPFDRNEDRVREELVALARNRAAVMGGNAIVLSQPAVEGEAGFEVYNCA